IRLTLEQEGYTVETAADGRGAMDAVRRDVPGMIFLDLKLPMLNGVEVLRTVKQIDPNVPVIVCSGYLESDLMNEAVRLSPLMVLGKPVNGSQIRAAALQASAGSTAGVAAEEGAYGKAAGT
ncbi:MAG: response regulator, partial [Lentisphaerae bacterium]|nr:response regulator [Lentisphaerota bacterium]